MLDGRYATSWRDLSLRGVRSQMRGAAVSALAASLKITGRMSALLRRPRVHVLLLHHVFADEEASFRALLSALARDHTFISYSEAARRAKAAGVRIDKPYVAITFDDGYKNCLRAAAIMNEFNAPGCFFVCPSIVGETDEAKIERFCRERLELPKPVEFMTWNDLESLKKRGHEIGGHTMSHVNLATAPREQARREIAECHDVIQSRLGECRHFAWTYGRFSDFPMELLPAVFDAGFESCASGVRGCHGPPPSDTSNPLLMRREHIVAGWPVSHALYFLARSSARIT
jgi:peptidoglycan/xylan/chitin deacetylase (PgdA/CDA1 family)